MLYTKCPKAIMCYVHVGAHVDCVNKSSDCRTSVDTTPAGQLVAVLMPFSSCSI